MKEYQINMKIVTICLFMALFSSCTSKPLSVRYYLLHTPEIKVSNTTLVTKSTTSTPTKTKPIAVLQSLDVADYLRQSSLVMQVDQHQLYYSRQDVWAEKLQSSFYKALLQDLNATGQRNYVASDSPNATQAAAAVTIRLDHFHATDSSTVVSSGRYWLSGNNQQIDKVINLTSSSHVFFFESDLKQDGYAAAVKQMRTLVTSLATQIEKDITALPNK
jgi:uncharacterized lipoprotein YmbA